jgi:gas vesicle protein
MGGTKEVVMSNGCGSRGFVIGFFAGTVLGALGALLMAPMSGSRLRRELSSEGRKLSNRVTEVAGEMREKGSDVYGAASEVVSDTARNLKKTAQSLSG